MRERNVGESMKHDVKSLMLVGLLLLSACSKAETKPTTCLDTPLTVIPYWVDGIIYVSSAMADKDRYWIKKYKDGEATSDDLIKVLESNVRFHDGMVGRMEAAKECAALARQELIDSQDDDR